MMVRVLEKKMNRDPLRSSKLKDFLIGIGRFSRWYLSLNLGFKLKLLTFLDKTVCKTYMYYLISKKQIFQKEFLIELKKLPKIV